MDPETVVRDFCRAASESDVEKLLGFFTDDAVYHNIPLDPVQGREAIEATLRQFLSPDGAVEFEVLHLATSGNTVLTERVDRLTLNGKPVTIPVMGAFEVTADGRISSWRDYFDMAQLTAQMA